MDYATPDNFTGQVLPGYSQKKAYALCEVAEALKEAAFEFSDKGYGILIFDAYRPVKAVEFFKIWSEQPENNPGLKNKYYPKFSRAELFELGYLARRSSHSRGVALDMSLYDLKTNQELQMGGLFDLFDEVSSTASKQISIEAQTNRDFLLQIMQRHGFLNFSQEWWHFSLKNEPHPDEYFDVDIS